MTADLHTSSPVSNQPRRIGPAEARALAMIAQAEKRAESGNGIAPMGRRYVQTVRFWSLSADAITVTFEEVKSEPGVTMNFVCIPRGIHIDPDAPPIQLDNPDMPSIPQFIAAPEMPEQHKLMATQIEDQRALAIQATANANATVNTIDAKERPEPTTDMEGRSIPPEVRADRAKINAMTAGAEASIAETRARQAADGTLVVAPEPFSIPADPNLAELFYNMAIPLVPREAKPATTNVIRSGERPPDRSQLKPADWSQMSRTVRRAWELQRYGDLIASGLSAYDAFRQAAAEVKSFG